MDYLGHRISASGIQPQADRVATIRLKPLTDELEGGVNGQLALSEQMAAAFEGSKTAMLNAAKLAHPLAGAELFLSVGTTGSHVGVVLHQRPGGSH